MCEKCGYLFLSKGWYRHKIACDGTGPKATDFRVNEVRETECRYCGKDFRWAPEKLHLHLSGCPSNPDHENYKRRKRLTSDYIWWIRSGRKPLYEETYERIRKHLKTQGLQDAAIDVLIEDIKKGSN